MDAALACSGVDFRAADPDGEDGGDDDDAMQHHIQAGEEGLPRAALRHHLHLFDGVEYRGKRHMNFLVERRKRLKAERDTARVEKERKQVYDAWDSRVTRRGDMVSHAATSGLAGNRSNEYRSEAVLRIAWRTLGKDVLEKTGVEGSGHGLAITSAVSSAVSHCQDVFCDDEIAGLPSTVVPCIRRLYDATPSRVRFGRLQQVLHPIARCPVLGDDGRWKCVPFSEFVHTHGGSRFVRHGVVDILASGAVLTYADLDTMALEGFKVIAKPRILARGNASCCYSAVEAAVKPLDSEGVRKISERCPFSYVVEAPDDAASNKRKKEQSRLDCSGKAGFVGSKCGSHQGHRVIESRQKKACRACVCCPRVFHCAVAPGQVAICSGSAT